MADFNIRTDAVDVEQIMRQIRARIQSKRGVDYTEEQIQELASVKLERFLDPKGVRSDLVEQFKRSRDRKLETSEPEQYTVDANDLYSSSRGFVRFMRKLFHPILKLLLNTNRLLQILHQQSLINAFVERDVRKRHEVDALYYELIHNLVLELTRIGIENRNVKMRLESLSSRMDFDERRARALETVVQYRPGTGPSREPQPLRARPPLDDRQPPQPRPAPPPAPASAEPPSLQDEATPTDPAADSTTARRRRRRRRGRRGGRGRTPGEGIATEGVDAEVASRQDSATPPHGDPTSAAAALDHGQDTDVDAGPESGADREDSGEEPDPSAQ